MNPRWIIFLAATCFAAAAHAQTTGPATTMPAILPIEYPQPAMLTDTGRARLAAERQVFGTELLSNPRYNPDLARPAIARMLDNPANTVQDNYRRFAEALAAVEPQFAEGWRLYNQGRFAEAADAITPLMAERVGIKQSYKHDTMSPYAYETTKFLFAQCQGHLGSMVEAIVAYQVVFEKLPDSFTFSCAARYRAAAMYEQTGRAHWALPIYKDILLRFGAMLSDQENLVLAAKVSALAKIDPYRQANLRAFEVEARLARGESGPAVRAAQQQLLELMSQMLAMNEEEERPFLESTQAIVFGADTGKLEKGTLGDAVLMGEDVAKVGADDWGTLRPREKQQLIQLFNQTYPQRYREMLEAYYRNVSAAEDAAAAKE